MGTVAVTGWIAHRPRRGGHAWVFIQYLLGLRKLGWNVVFVDRLPEDTDGDARSVEAVMEEVGLAGAFAVVGPGGTAVAGIALEEVDH